MGNKEKVMIKLKVSSGEYPHESTPADIGRLSEHLFAVIGVEFQLTDHLNGFGLALGFAPSVVKVDEELE